MSIYNVKCISINSLNKTVEYVQQDMTGEIYHGLGYSHGQMIFISDSKLDYCIYFNKPTTHHGGVGLEDYGFLWNSSDYDKEPVANEDIDYYFGQFYEGGGNALIVASKRDRSKKSIPKDIDLSLEWVKKRIIEFTAGVHRQVPEFTCMLSPKFDEPEEYELLLRIENKDLLDYQYEVNFNKPLRQLTSQMITFSIDYNEITIIVGKFRDLDQKIRVMIIRNDQIDLTQVSAITITANKAPAWIKNTLETFFKKKLIDDRIKPKYQPKHSQEISPLTLVQSDLA